MRWCIWSGLSWNRADDEIINSWAQVNMAGKWEIKTWREPINHNYLGGYFESSVLINRKRVIALISVVINSKNACIQPSVKSEHLVNLKFKQFFFLHYTLAVHDAQFQSFGDLLMDQSKVLPSTHFPRVFHTSALDWLIGGRDLKTDFSTAEVFFNIFSTLPLHIIKNVKSDSWCVQTFSLNSLDLTKILKLVKNYSYFST